MTSPTLLRLALLFSVAIPAGALAQSVSHATSSGDADSRAAYASPAQRGLSLSAPLPGAPADISGQTDSKPATKGDPDGEWNQSRDQTRGVFSNEYNNRTTTNNASAATVNSSSSH